jgi:hypothetical protein
VFVESLHHCHTALVGQQCTDASGRRAGGRFGLIAVFVVGLIARVVLIPLGHGQDFIVWDKASAASLHGVNVYVHHPDYPGGPFAYFPLFLYIEMPMQWLAIHTGLSFTVLGKLPILAGDIATAALIANAVAGRGTRRPAIALATAMFWLNPLVLYDGAYYGRFDSIGCALLLLALRHLRSRGDKVVSSAAWYGLAIAAKTFPAFVVAGVFRAAKGSRIRAAAVSSAVLTLLLLPYLASMPAVLHDVITYDATKTAGGLSWQTLLQHTLATQDARRLGYVLLAMFVALTIWFTRILDLDRYVLLTLVLFLCLSKVVIEQYLIWPMPWLAIATVTVAGAARRRAAAALLVILTVIGALANESYHPLGRSSSLLVLLLLCACLVFLAVDLNDRAHSPVAKPNEPTRPSPLVGP